MIPKVAEEAIAMLVEHNRAIWIQIAAANIAAGSLDPVRLATDIVASALGM